MADDDLLDKVHNLSDIELAVLLCLISREHCLISTPSEALNDLVGELHLIATRTFGLTCVTVDCHANTTLEDFATSLLLPTPSSPYVRPGSTSPLQTRGNDSYFQSQSVATPPLIRGGGLQPPRSPLISSSSSGACNATGTSTTALPGPGAIANVVLARNLDHAPSAVQAQALELLRTRRIFTRTTVQTAPRPFLLVAVVGADSGGQARVNPHLNDLLYMAHWHDPEDGFVNLEEMRAAEDIATEPVFSDADVSTLAKATQDVQFDIEVVRYQMNIVSFLRIHRAVDGGITPTATKHFERLIKCLAPLHRLDFVTPSLVAMAAKKVYLHRIKMVKAQAERSMQWGSDLAAVKAVLEDIGPEDVIEDVIAMVTPPV
ncbi:hypothetical protein MCOR27_004777 [Pyricularia oryzae]|uniref:magnesium chelatase n=3 Tax=Pyricularia TaxID=48558 RepID=A0ABQ8NWG8_PYRGI|nr:uncharacterized protein MGG_08145 [Pyricularia oryzae 70-15]KAH8839510.1 hypothetical protein MCOR01_008706 [Pyricularia oryzae]KAI6303091.1 hypothetical protein MCOR33_001688 [Pyricularia grisea]EHA55301.1 hypothetical protein MGG_08145 [Pyricularia oryzae 70-15]KAH9439365.1 hypothetical protein MCOR02_002924 [Pyricularia oryzae]KAI6255947.1 hypothetical protein MCOR19_007574 [Pyricularia oryzae]